MRQLLSIMLTMLLIFLPTLLLVSANDSNNSWTGEASLSFDKGRGTKKDPYLIATPEQLAYFSSSVNSGNSFKGEYIKVISDLDLGGKKWTPIAEYKSPRGVRFEGDFNGNNKIISNMLLDYPEKDVVGLFGIIGIQGNVYGIRMDNTSRVNGNECVGAVAGVNLFGTVSHCYVDINVSGNKDVGGLVGCNYGLVTVCSSEGLVYGSTDSVGGLVGYNHTGVIANCHNNGIIKSEYASNVGGMTGYNEGEVTNSYNSGDVISKNGSNVGGIVGKNINYVNNCYSSAKLGGIKNVGGIVGLNTGYEICSYKSKVYNCFWNERLFGGLGVNNNNPLIYESLGALAESMETSDAILTGLNKNVNASNKIGEKVYLMNWSLSKLGCPELVLRKN